jgi:ankyrin repeat protein
MKNIIARAAALLSALALGWLNVVSGAPGTSAVADAAQAGDRTAVANLLKQAADVNAAQADGMTALHWAALRDDAALAQTLLYAGANVKATTRLNAYTPLLLAAKDGRASVIDPLVKAGADVNGRTSNGTTPLMFAAASGSMNAVMALVDRGADVNAKEPVRGFTAIMFAAASDRAPVVNALAQRGANLRATTSVVDINSMGRGAFAGVLFGNPQGQGGQGGQAGGAGGGQGQGQFGGQGGGGGRFGQQGTAGIDRQYQLNELVYAQGGLAAIHLAARQGYASTIDALLASGADINQPTAGDRTTPLVVATINGHFDLAKSLLDRGADPALGSENGVTALYAALNCEWAPKALYPQPRAYINQKTSYLDLMKALLDKGADPNARIRKKVWYSGYSFDLSGVDEGGATAFWRAAYASDIEAMRMLVSYGADPTIPTMKGGGRPRTADVEREVTDVAKTPPVPVGGPGVPAIVAAAGSGYGEGFAANSHRYAPTGMLAAVKYLVEELGADVNATDHEGNTALHNAAARGDVELIQYLVSKGANVKAVNREGRTTADMANGPVQRIQPWPDALALLEKLGAKNNHKCVSC